MDREGRHDSIRFFNILVAVSLFLTVFTHMTSISATSNVYNNTE